MYVFSSCLALCGQVVKFVIILAFKAGTHTEFQVPTSCVSPFQDSVFGEIYFILFWAFLAVAPILNLLQVPTGCVWQLPNPVFGEIRLILGPFWPGTHTEFVSGTS